MSSKLSPISSSGGYSPVKESAICRLCPITFNRRQNRFLRHFRSFHNALENGVADCRGKCESVDAYFERARRKRVLRQKNFLPADPDFPETYKQAFYILRRNNFQICQTLIKAARIRRRLLRNYAEAYQINAYSVRGSAREPPRVLNRSGKGSENKQIVEVDRFALFRSNWSRRSRSRIRTSVEFCPKGVSARNTLPSRFLNAGLTR